MPSTITYVATLRCADAPGIVFATTSAIVAVGGNIVENDQFTDPVTDQFCMRTRFESPETDVTAVRARLTEELARFVPVLDVRRQDVRRRAVVMVSEYDHCLADLLYRIEHGDLPLEIAAVVSNHSTLAPLAQHHGVAFVEVPVTPATRSDAEIELRRLVSETEADFIILARYMQVLSPELCAEFEGRIVNIHHSFLPGFTGARPYHRAYERGVKLIGATAHFVTAELDEGPIIDQDVARVSHARRPEELVAIGRDIERSVLSRAVKLLAEDRVALVGQRTVIFSQ
jgi:formyltetrahydrofolate deformylase